jgi:hypothetical protein
MTKASSHPMEAEPSSSASAVQRSFSAKSEFYPKARWNFFNDFRCKRKRMERPSSQPRRETGGSLNTRYPVIRSSGSSLPRLSLSLAQWTVTSERLVVCQTTTRKRDNGHLVFRAFGLLCQHLFLHSSRRPHHSHLKAKRALPI